MLNKQSTLDTTKLITGKDGELFITTKDNIPVSLAEVDTFQVQISFNNTDYQPVGSSLSYAVTTGYTVTLTFTEAVVRDNILLEKLFDELKNGYFPQFDFSGKLRRKDGQVSKQVYRNCIPDGSVDLMNVTPGDIIKRQWSFRVNSVPEVETYFKEIK